MSKVVIASSSDSDNRKIDEYHDNTSDSGSSSNSGSRSNSSGSSGGNTTDEQYMSKVLGVPLKVLQEVLRMRAASGSQASTSTNIPPSTVLDEVEAVYSCVVGIHSKTDEKRLTSLRSWYQIPDNLNPRLAVHGEWCCGPHFGIGVYEAYLLGRLRLSLMLLLESYLLG